MDRIHIRGGNRLEGTIPISGAKNAALPLMAASLLTPETLTLSNLPHLQDITTLANLLAQHGVAITMDGDAGKDGHAGRTLSLTAAEITNTTAPYELVRRMRASILVLGPLLTRAGRAKVSLPGGCAIGSRPIDLHLKGLASLGAEIELGEGYIQAVAPRRLKGAHIVFPSVSVGATENLLMAAVLAEGETVLEGAAREPEVADLVRCLTSMGARIQGVGTDKLRIQGIDQLGGARHEIEPDRIETGTYAMAAAITSGALELLGGRLDQIGAVAEALTGAGVKLVETNRGIHASRSDGALTCVDVTTGPFPGFPTDLQAQMTACMATAEGASTITENIFESRFAHVPELTRMGANIKLKGASAMVRGVDRLIGAPVMATDLRASVSLVLAGLAAEGETTISRVYHLDRGYERLEEKLAACGADIERVREKE